MSEELLVARCSPTLAGLKTANLFSCACADRAALYRMARRWNTRLVPKGLCALPLRFHDGRALVYFYRHEHLKRDLCDERAREMLRLRGYPVESVNGCLAELARRVNTDASFPHEIGLFLGYPPYDVDCFIRRHAAGAKCTGTWKVYGDDEAAKKQFEAFRKCTDVYRRAYARNHSLERLIVSS